jgi:cobyrinic acid a,c-diamide synthase
MYLAEKLLVGGETWPMVGALPVAVEQTGRPQGHGYVSARVDAPNPFLHEGSVLCEGSVENPEPRKP